MPRYIYTAKSQPNQTIQGNIEAESEQEVINKLNKMGFFPTTIQPESLLPEKQGLLSFRKISKKDINLFTRQLSNLVESGVNILNSLNIVSGQSGNKYFQAILHDVVSKIKDGRSLSDSLSTHPGIFSSLYTSTIRSGEAGGTLEQTLKRLADFLEKEEEFKNSIRAALTYPFFIIIVSILTVIVLLYFVIPRLVGMFEDMGQALPLPTQILINLSNFLRNRWWLILAIIFIFIFFLRRFYLSPGGRNLFDRLKLKIAIFGDIALKTEISRLSRTLSLLLSSGITIISALDISASILENQTLRAEAQKFRDDISGGSSLSRCLDGSKLFPKFVTNIIVVAEETGTLEKSLMRIADEYEREVDRTLKAFTQLLEPVIILVMGLVVGFIVLSMLLPIFQINLIAR